MLKGLEIGLAAGAVNFGIDNWSNSYEDEMNKGSLNSAEEADKKDINNTLGIIAKTI